MKLAITQTHPVTIFFGCTGAGFPTAELATLSVETRTIGLATRALAHFAESHGVNLTFTHVHSHKGHGLTELADNVAKVGADCMHCRGLLYQLDQRWCHNSGVRMGLVDASEPLESSSVWLSTC